MRPQLKCHLIDGGCLLRAPDVIPFPQLVSSPFLVFVCLVFVGWFLREGFFVSPWLFWNSLGRPSWRLTQEIHPRVLELKYGLPFSVFCCCSWRCWVLNPGLQSRSASTVPQPQHHFLFQVSKSLTYTFVICLLSVSRE